MLRYLLAQATSYDKALVTHGIMQLATVFEAPFNDAWMTPLLQMMVAPGVPQAIQGTRDGIIVIQEFLGAFCVFFKTILCAKMDLLGVVLMFYVFFFVFFGSFWLFLALFLSFFGHFYLQFDYQAKWRHSMPHMSQC